MLKSVTGIFCRIVLSGFSPLSMEGAAMYGGRWNKEGEKALYLSEQVDCAIKEVRKRYLTRVEPQTLEKVKNQGFLIAIISLHIDNVLDLSDKNIREKLGIKLEDIVQSDHKKCQSIAHELKKKFPKLSAILYPSAVDLNCKNIVILKNLPPLIEVTSRKYISFKELISSKKEGKI